MLLKVSYFVLHAYMQSNCLLITCLFAIAMQTFQPLKEELLNLERGVVMHDASIAKDVLVVAPVLLVKCDNPIGLLNCLATRDQC